MTSAEDHMRCAFPARLNDEALEAEACCGIHLRMELWRGRGKMFANWQQPMGPGHDKALLDACEARNPDGRKDIEAKSKIEGC